MRPFPIAIQLPVNAGQNGSITTHIKGHINGISTSWISGTDPIVFFELWIGGHKVTQSPIHVAHFASHQNGGELARPFMFPVHIPDVDAMVTIGAHNTDIIDGKLKLTLWVDNA